MADVDDDELRQAIIDALRTPSTSVHPRFQRGKYRDEPLHYLRDDCSILDAVVAECCGCSWPAQPELLADIIIEHLRIVRTHAAN